MTVLKRSREVREELKKYNFSMDVNTLPDIPEKLSDDLVFFISTHLGNIPINEQRELLSYIMFVVTPESFAFLIETLEQESGRDIKKIMPEC